MPFSRYLRNLWRISPVATVFAGLVAAFCFWVLIRLGPEEVWLAWHLAHLSPADAADVSSAASSETLLLAGRLDGNPTGEHDFVLYELERWTVKTDSDGFSSGKWVASDGDYPDLWLLVNGKAVRLQGNPEVTLLGDVHLETYAAGSGRPLAVDAVHPPDGSLRYRGLKNGDEITVLGRKTAAGVLPAYLLMGGDLETIRALEWQRTRSLFLAVLTMLVVATPLTYVLTLVFMGEWRKLLQLKFL